MNANNLYINLFKKILFTYNDDIMSGKSVVGSIIGSTIISVLIIGALLFFIGPMLLPGLTEQDDELAERDLVLQYKYDEWNTAAYIWDHDDSSYMKMEDTEINITIEQDSRIYATFSAMALLSLDDSFAGRSSYNISLVVEDVVNRTIMVIFFDSAPATSYYRETSVNLFINLVTDSLPAGTYTVAIYWKSTYNAIGTNSLSVAHAPKYNYTRTMFIQELKSI